MDNLDILVFNALNKYFKTLSYTGSISDLITNQLLLLTFIKDFYEECKCFLLEEDKNTILNILSCMQGSCFIPKLNSDLLPISTIQVSTCNGY